MSSLPVRTALKAAVEAAASPVSVLDLSDYTTLEDALSDVDDEAVLIQYAAADETIKTIGGPGNQGWEEDGAVVLHFVTARGFASTPVVTKCDAIREALRGQRLSNTITIRSCDPFTDFGVGGVESNDGAWKRWAANLFIVRRDCG